MYSIKPDLIFDIPSKLFYQSVYNIKNINNFFTLNQEYFLKNSSENICYDISVKTFIYLSNDSWDRYYKFTNRKADKISVPTLATEDYLYSLDKNIKFGVNIPAYYHFFNIASIDGLKIHPTIYTVITYKDKMGNFYEDSFEFDRIVEIIGESNYIIDFEPRFKNINEVKEKLFKQKKYLEKELKVTKLVYYYNL